MSKRLAVTAAPGCLESYCEAFDDLFSKRNQREAFRRYLEGLLLSNERNKTLTGLANTEPVVGSSHREAQKLQWFLSESSWDPEALNQRRLQLLQEQALTATTSHGVLVIDETGDRKWGSKTAHVGRQYLGSIGKVDNGVVSVHSLWADERLYYPLALRPFTPERWFAKGKADKAYRTKPQLALDLVEAALATKVAFRAVVADCFYGGKEAFKDSLQAKGVPFVLALPPSHAWWHLERTVGSVQELAQASPWQADAPGAWLQLTRHFRDAHQETWWVLEGEGGPYGKDKTQRLVIATTDPATLPELSTWYLCTNLPAPASPPAKHCGFAPADLAEIVRLYSLRVWVEQSYKQVKQHLGWAEYQVRKDLAMRRHWQLVLCAFSFCWWALTQESAPAHTEPTQLPELETSPLPPEADTRRKKKRAATAADRFAQLACGLKEGEGLFGALSDAQPLLACLVSGAPT